MSNAIDKTLEERKKTTGSFTANARSIQCLKNIVRRRPNWESLPATHRESIEMILHKIGRICNGDSYHADHWHDIQGYARLVEKDIIESKECQHEVVKMEHREKPSRL